jgi:hypothetical protein
MVRSILPNNLSLTNPFAAFTRAFFNMSARALIPFQFRTTTEILAPIRISNT